MRFLWFILQWRKPKEEEKPKRKPVSTLDEIVHDYQWYTPKERNKTLRADQRGKQGLG